MRRRSAPRPPATSSGFAPDGLVFSEPEMVPHENFANDAHKRPRAFVLRGDGRWSEAGRARHHGRLAVEAALLAADGDVLARSSILPSFSVGKRAQRSMRFSG